MCWHPIGLKHMASHGRDMAKTIQFYTKENKTNQIKKIMIKSPRIFTEIKNMRITGETADIQHQYIVKIEPLANCDNNISCQ